ncbi:MAG TPA: PEP-CTERM sorting domain-containing protein [Candidatus Didemnitutus sp.]|nr:PEP-CTERM sorting domain-containing protein [Candidatus Didemnitutus sp.]
MKSDRRTCLRLSWLVALAVGVGFAIPAWSQTTFTWNGGNIVTGSITPSSVSTVGAADTLNIVTSNDHDFNGFVLTNNGVINWQAGNLRSGNGGEIVNNATWNDTAAGYQFNNAFGGAPLTFINGATGTYNKTSGVSDFTIAVTNSGTINVSGGTLNIDAGGTFTNGSVAGSSGSGVLQLTNGTLTATGNVTLTNFLFNGGTLAGDHTFVNSVINWQGGNWNSGNTTTLAANTTVNLISANDHDYNSHAIVNNGTVNWTMGNVRSGNGGTITNNGMWVDTANGYQFNNAYGGAQATFTNAAGATYLKTTGTSSFEIPFFNNGTVTVTGGTLSLDNGGTFSDGSSIGSSGSGVVQLTNGVLSGSGTAGFTATNFVIAGGQVGDGVTFLGTTNWTTGNFNTVGTSTIAAGGLLNLTNSNDHDYNGHTMVNNGTVDWTAGNIRSGNSGLFVNNSVFNDSADGYQFNNAYGGAQSIFHNTVTGTYNKTAGASLFANSTLLNDGTISVTGGTLSLDGGTLDAGSTIGSSGAGVVQLVSGTLNVNGTVNVQNFQFNGGTLAGTQTFNGTLTWNTSDLSGGGATTIAPTTTLTVATGNDHNFNAHTIVNDGTVNWTGGNLRSGNAGVFLNNSVFNDTSDGYQISNAYGGTQSIFHNAVTGVYNKTAGATSIVNNTLVNDGVISVTGGTLSLDGGTLNDGSTIGSSGLGVVQLVSNTLNVNGTVNVQNFLFNGGTLAGTQTFNGTLTWNTTDLSGGGATTLSPSTVLTIATGNDHNFNAHTIVNDGTVNWTSGNLRSGNAGVFLNNGAFNDTAGSFQISNAYGGLQSIFHNAASGIYTKSSGSTSIINNTLVNDGIINVSGGSISLDGGTLNNGSFIGSTGGGLVQLVSGTLTANGIVTLGNFQFNGGVLSGNPTFDGTFSWVSTDFSTPTTTTVGATGVMSIVSANDHNFNGHAIVNAGVTDWVAGNLRTGNAGSITNYGVWVDTADTYTINNAYGGAAATFTNAVGGTYTKTSGASSIQIPVLNLGTIVVAGGTLGVTSTYSDAAGRILLDAGGNFSASNPISLSNGSLLLGEGTFTAPSLNLSGAIKPGTLTTAGTLTIDANTTVLSPAFLGFEIGGTNQGSDYDHLTVNGTLALGGNLQIGFINGFQSTITNSMTFDLVSSTSLSNSFLNVANGSRLWTADGLGSFVVNYGAGSSFGVNDIVLSSFTPVPEPSTWLLMVAGGAGMLGWCVRRRRN